MVKDGLFQVAFNGAFGNFWSALMKIPQVEILRIKDDGNNNIKSLIHCQQNILHHSISFDCRLDMLNFVIMSITIAKCVEF